MKQTADTCACADSQLRIGAATAVSMHAAQQCTAVKHFIAVQHGMAVQPRMSHLYERDLLGGQLAGPLPLHHLVQRQQRGQHCLNIALAEIQPAGLLQGLCEQ